MSEDSFAVSVGLGLIKSVACAYDLITLPFYSAAQRPWAAHRISDVKARPTKSSDPYSPYTRTGSPPDHFVFHVKTVAELFSRICGEDPGKRSFGKRDVLEEVIEVQPNGRQFKKFVLSDYKWFSRAELDERIDNIARGLMVHGVRPGDVVVILAETQLEWMLTAQAIFRLGGTIATVYATLGDDGLVHGIQQTEVTHVVTSHDMVPKLKNLKARLSKIKKIIYFEGLKAPDTTGLEGITLVPFSKVENLGKTEKAGKFSPPLPDDPAVIMYTSGSTGAPKGVILTHRNILTTIRGFYEMANCLENKPGATYIAFLPLAHVLELAAETFFFSIGHEVGYATPNTLTETGTALVKGVASDASLLRPTVMAAVPLVLDRVRKGAVEKATNAGNFAKAFLQFVVDYKTIWMKRGFQTPLINLAVCKKSRALLGGRIEHIVTGSAPLSPDTMDFVRSVLNVAIIQGYGLTETAAAGTIMDINDRSTGVVGPPLYGIKIKLVDWNEGNYFVTDKPRPRGEIVIGGDCVAAGYFKNDLMTSEYFREEDGTRWFYTGDIGEVCPNGSIKIIDRKKDLIKLQFGEYISLGKVETELKSCPIVDNICVYGDSLRDYVVALVVPNQKVIDNLASSLGKDHLTKEQKTRDPQIVQEALTAIQKYGRNAKLSEREIPKKIFLTTEEWTPDNELVTAAFKIRRKKITDHYRSQLDSLYGGRLVSNGSSDGNSIKST